MNKQDKNNLNILKRLSKFREIDPVTQCWNWTGGFDNRGYGKLNIRICKNKVKTIAVHRYSYSFYTSTFLFTDNVIHHKCKNKKCFNPAHLALISREDHVSEHSHKSEEWKAFCNQNKDLINRMKEIEKEIKIQYSNWIKNKEK